MPPLEDPRAEAWDEKDVSELLRLEKLDEDLFRNRFSQINVNGSLYGGQVLAQALAAAAETVAERLPHSAHAYFLRPGSDSRPVIYDVERTRDGGSYSTRRVVARQAGRTILYLTCSFNAPEGGFSHAEAWSELPPPPESLPDLAALCDSDDLRLAKAAQARVDEFKNIEIRPVDPEAYLALRPGPARLSFWIRAAAPVPADSMRRAAGMLYLSDYGLVRAALRARPEPTPVFMASLDHAFWFHAFPDPSDWLLFETESPWSGQGRALGRGAIYDRRGVLAASAAQEALLRSRESRPDKV